MLTLIEVQCPHCGARGQIMVPPVGAIIIGPCPQCNELVVVFCGHVLALDKETMENGTTENRRDHLLEVLTEYLQDKIAKLIGDPEEIELDQGDIEELGAPQKLEDIKRLISQVELERFTDVDLRLLDNKAYFNSIFDTE